ncbi:unnamed protein product [Brassica oleracea var. botrytis]
MRCTVRLCHPDCPVSVATHLELMVLVLEGATPISHGSQVKKKDGHLSHSQSPFFF